jgi:hypothetical protein
MLTLDFDSLANPIAPGNRIFHSSYVKLNL